MILLAVYPARRRNLRPWSQGKRFRRDSCNGRKVLRSASLVETVGLLVIGLPGPARRARGERPHGTCRQETARDEDASMATTQPGKRPSCYQKAVAGFAQARYRLSHGRDILPMTTKNVGSIPTFLRVPTVGFEPTWAVVRRILSLPCACQDMSLRAGPSPIDAYIGRVYAITGHSVSLQKPRLGRACDMAVTWRVTWLARLRRVPGSCRCAPGWRTS